MSFNAVRENKILAKISEITVMFKQEEKLSHNVDADLQRYTIISTHLK